MRQGQRWAVCCVGFLVGLGVLGLGVGSAEDEEKEKALPTVFQAAGPTAESI
jgi:hypothetical protein